MAKQGTNIKRLLVYLAIAGSVAIAIAMPFLKTAIENRLRVYLEKQATGLTSVPVSIDALRLSLIPAGLRIRTVHMGDHAASPSFLAGSVERVDVWGGPLSLLGLRPGIVAIDVAAPRLRATVDRRADEGEAPPARDGLSNALVAIPFAWEFSLGDGEVDLELPGRLDVDLRGIEMQLQSRRAFGTAGGQIGFTQGAIHGVPGNWEGLRGEARIELSSDGIAFDPLSLHAPGLILTGEGSVADRLPLAARGKVRIEVRHGILDVLLPAGAVSSGALRADLEGAWNGDATSLTGAIDLEGLRLWEVTIANLHAALRLDDAIHVEEIRMDLLGGRGTGTIEADPSAPGGPAARANVRFESIDLAAILALAGWRGPELSGTLNYDGRHEIVGLDPGGLSGSGRLQLQGRYRSPRGGELSLTAAAGVETAGMTLRFSEGTLQAGAARAEFAGEFSPARGLNLRLRGATGDLSELLLLFPPPPPPAPPTERHKPARLRSAPAGGGVVHAVRRAGVGGRAARQVAARNDPGAPPPPLQRLEALLGSLGGRWEWDGDLSYVAGDIGFEGELRGSDLTFMGETLGALQADVTFAGGMLRIRSATLRRPSGGSIRLGGRLGLGDEGVIDLTGEVNGFPAAVLRRVAAVDLPIDGELGGSFSIGGSRDHPEVRLRFDMEDLVVAGVPLQTVQGDMTITAEGIATESLRLESRGGAVDITGGLRLRGGPGREEEEGRAPPARLELVARDIDLSSLGPLLGDLPLAGRAAASVTISGSLEVPVGRLAANFSEVRVWERSIGAASINARIDPQRILIEGEIPARMITLRGSAALDDTGQFDLRAYLDGTRIDGQELYADAPEGSELLASGEMSLAGALRGAEGVTAALELSSLQMSMPGFEIASSAPVIARLHDQMLRLEPVRLVGIGTHVDLQGEIDLGAGGALDASAHGYFDLSLLRTIVRQIQATGEGEVEVTARGVPGSLDLRGDLRIVAERVRYTDVRIPVDDLKAHLVFEGDEARIEELRFLTGGGSTVGSGTLQLGNPDQKGGLGAIRSGALRLQGNNIKASVPEGFQSVSDLDLELSVDASGATLRGRVDLLRGIYSRDFQIESSLIGNGQPAVPELPPLAGLLGEVKLDCTLNAAGEVGLRNDLGRIDGEGALRVGGTVARPELTGRLTALEGGRVTLRGVRYRVVQGTIDFDDPLAIDPRFEIRAETSVDEYQISLGIRGRADDFDFDLTSIPPLSESDIVALLVTGRTLGDVGVGGGSLAEGLASSYLAGQLTQELTNQISALSGLDVLMIDPIYVSGQGDPTTRITVGKRLTPDLFVTYSDLIGSDSGSIYQLDYFINRDVRFSSLRDVDGSLGGDLSYSLRSAPPWLPGLDLRRPGEARREIATIRIEGEPRFSESRVLRRAKLKPGRRRSGAELHDAVDRLLNFYRGRGYLMADIRLEDMPSDDGGIDLVLGIRTGPRISIEFDGIRGHQGLLEKAEPFWEEGLFMDEIVETVRGRLEDYIHDRGYLTAGVEAAVVRDDDDAFKVLFTVRRGPRAQADRIEVTGVSRMPRDEVLGAIESSTDTWRSRGIVRGERLRNDREAIRQLYLHEGFSRAAVSAPEILLDDAGERAEVTFHVDEGPRVVLHGMRFEGAASLARERLRAVTGLREGAPYRAAAVEEAIVQLRRAYDGAGFPDARVTVELETLTQLGGYELVDITFRVIEGLPQRVAEVTINGNLITGQKVIRRAIQMEPGDPLSRGALQESRSRLYRTGSFRGVQVEAMPDSDAAERDNGAGEEGAGERPEPEPGGPRFRPLQVTVQEAGRFRQLFGIGYDSEERIRGQYEIANRNLFGSGRFLGLQTRASSLDRRGSVVFRETGVFGGRFDLLASAFWQDETLTAFDVRRVGGAVQLSRQVSRATYLRYRYSIEDVDLSDPNVVFDESTLRLSSLSFSASHDTRDNPFNPLRGHYLVGDISLADQAIGSEADFTRFYAQVYTFREVLPHTVWAQAVRVGIAVPFGRSKADPTSTGDAVSGLPPTRRFYAGGDTTIRGFERNRVGPLDPAGDPIGGEGLFILNEELRYPIFRQLQGVVFYDAGNVYRTLDRFALRNVRHVAGAGLRIATPIGPFRLEYGRILDPGPNDTSRGEFFISIGQAF